MTKPRLVALAGAFGAVAFLGYEISRRLLEIGTLPTLNVRRYTIGPGAVILAEGSWKKAGGSGMAVPEPNAVRIRCDTNAGECKMDEAQVEDWSGSRYLRLLETEDYHIVSWGDGILVAQALNSYGAAPEDHDVTLRISVTDKTVTRTWHGKRMKLLGKNVDLSSEWLEETLK
jgi:hypothetical protein